MAVTHLLCWSSAGPLRCTSCAPASTLLAQSGTYHMTGAGWERKRVYSIVKQLVVKVTDSGDSSTTVNASGSCPTASSFLRRLLCQVGHLRLCLLLLFSLALLACLLKNLFPSPAFHLNFLQEGLIRTPTLIRISCELIGSFFGVLRVLK